MVLNTAVHPISLIIKQKGIGAQTFPRPLEIT